MSYVDEVFGEQGAIAKAIAGYRPRAGQIELARGVDAAIVAGENLIGEGPTGTGKSLAYAVPAAWHAARVNPHRKTQRAKVAIVTANIALQEQIVTKDLPLLQRVLPWEFTFALAKGRSNYLCIDAYEDAVADSVMSKIPFEDPRDRQQWAEVTRWVRQTQMGDLSELSFEPSANVRLKIATTAEDCHGKLCESYDDCHANRARAAAEQADVVVTNYHLLFAHFAVLEATEGSVEILPAFDVVVFDEAHKAADIAREFFGFRVTVGQVRWAARLLDAKKQSKKAPVPTIDPELKERIGDLADDFFGRLRTYKHGGRYKTRLKEERAVQHDELRDALYSAAEKYQATSEDPSLEPLVRHKLRTTANRARSTAQNLQRAVLLSHPSEEVVFIDEDQKERVTLCAKAVSAAPTLERLLFKSESVRSVVATSATLTTGVRSFDYIKSELGAGDAKTMAVASPFEWSKQALLVLPTGLPQPNEPAFGQAVGELLARVVHAARGRTLGLFTSYRGLHVATSALEEARLGYPVMRQGDAPRTQLVQRFREDSASVLLGTESFWTGVDVPGESLSCVLIDRLPFEPQDDPVLDAIRERDPSGCFMRYQVPRAAIALRQGVGRLIRAVSDRGVVVVCDRRLIDKPYGKVFLRSLPPMRITRDIGDISRFLDGKVGE